PFVSCLSFFLLFPRPHRSTLFPYTTLFRSPCRRNWTSPVIILYWKRTALIIISLSAFMKMPLRIKRSYLFHLFFCNPSWKTPSRSEEHTSELQSRENLVCRLLLEKKKYTTS